MTAEDAQKAHHAERIQTPPPLEIEEFLSLALSGLIKNPATADQS